MPEEVAIILAQEVRETVHDSSRTAPSTRSAGFHTRCDVWISHAQRLPKNVLWQDPGHPLAVRGRLRVHFGHHQGGRLVEELEPRSHPGAHQLPVRDFSGSQAMRKANRIAPREARRLTSHPLLVIQGDPCRRRDGFQHAPLSFRTQSTDPSSKLFPRRDVRSRGVHGMRLSRALLQKPLHHGDQVVSLFGTESLLLLVFLPQGVTVLSAKSTGLADLPGDATRHVDIEDATVEGEGRVQEFPPSGRLEALLRQHDHESEGSGEGHGVVTAEGERIRQVGLRWKSLQPRQHVLQDAVGVSVRAVVVAELHISDAHVRQQCGGFVEHAHRRKGPHFTSLPAEAVPLTPVHREESSTVHSSPSESRRRSQFRRVEEDESSGKHAGRQGASIVARTKVRRVVLLLEVKLVLHCDPLLVQ